jgi:hypothetical protein
MNKECRLEYCRGAFVRRILTSTMREVRQGNLEKSSLEKVVRFFRFHNPNRIIMLLEGVRYEPRDTSKRLKGRV